MPVAAAPSGRGLGVLAVLLAATCWSFGGVLGKSAGAEGVTLSFWRLWMSSAVITVVAVARHRVPTRAELKKATAAGILFGCNLCAFWVTLQYTTVAVALIIGALSPVLALPIAATLMGERVTGLKVGCAVVAVAGVVGAVLTAPPGDGGDTRVVGYLWAVASLLVWVVYLLLTKRARALMGTLQFMTAVTWIATLTVAAVAFATRRDLGQIHGAGWVWTALLALIPGLTGHGLIAWAQPRVDASVTAVLIQLEPVGASLTAWAFLGERMSGWQGVAMVVVVAAPSTLAWSESREGAVVLDDALG